MAQDSYTQQQDYTHIENCPDLNDLLSLPQDVMAAMTANVTAAAAAAAAAMESGNLQWTHELVTMISPE